MKQALIIGASSGIGYELSHMLATNGWKVHALARRISLLENLYTSHPESITYASLDVTDTVQTRAILTRFFEENPTDLVINCAGWGDLNTQFEYAIEAQTNRVNIDGFTAIANCVTHHFIHRKSGHFVNISSIAALRGGRESPAYNASKAYQSNYLEGIRAMVVHQKLSIAITDIQPGLVDTAMAKGEGLFWVQSPKKVAGQIVKAIEKKKRQVIVTRRWKLIAALLKRIPAALYERM